MRLEDEILTKIYNQEEKEEGGIPEEEKPEEEISGETGEESEEDWE